MPPAFAQLKSRQLIRVNGAGTVDFLQGLLSNDLMRLAPRHAVFAALLSPQGKLLFDIILIHERADSVLLDVEAARAEELIAKLKLYRLRAKLDVAASDLAVFAVYGEGVTNQLVGEGHALLCFRDPRMDALGLRLVGPKAELRTHLRQIGASETGEEAYIAHRLALGVPEGASELGIEKAFLLEANLEELNGVDFKKGCYVGQELTARMKHKSELKKRLLPFRRSSQVEPGATLTANGRDLGSVVGARAQSVFALVRLDRLAEADPAALTIGNEKVVLEWPAYLEPLRD